MKDKIIIFDVDGTAIDSPTQKLPSDELVQSINDLKDKYVLSAATGRGWTFAKDILQAMELSDPCIVSAGTQICDPKTGKILWQQEMPDSAVEKVVEVFRQYPDFKMLANDYEENDYLFGGLDSRTFKQSESVYFLAMTFVPEDLAPEIYNKLSLIDDIVCVMVVAQKPGFRDLHVINKNATKEHAVAKLLNMTGTKAESSIGIGEGPNDIHLFNAVHLKVAMDNAVPELKAIADLVIGSVEDDGLAKYLQTLK